MSKRLLVEEALRVAQKGHGALGRAKRREKWYGKTGVEEVGTAIQLLSLFPRGDHLARRAAQGICTTLGSSTHLTPGPALKKRLQQSYLASARSPPPPGSAAERNDWTTASYRGAWAWTRDRVEAKVKEWGEVDLEVENVLELVQRAREGDNQLDRQQYAELLKVCMCILTSQRRRGSKSDGSPPPLPLLSPSPPLSSLLDAMVMDCGAELAQDILLSGSFQLATTQDQIRTICETLGSVARSRPAVFQTEQLAASLVADSSSKRSMDLFTLSLLGTETPPTMDMFESMLHMCARGNDLQWALKVFHAMTHKYEMAPSREAYNTLTNLIGRRAFRMDKFVGVGTCHQVLAAAEHAYSGRPPLWVYAEMTKPLLPLMGRKGYHIMFSHCEKTLDKMGVRDKGQRKVFLRGVWRKSLYVTLVKGAVVRSDGEMALFMLGEMRGWGFSMTTKAYEHLLQLVRSTEDLDQYLMPLLKGMTSDLTGSQGRFMQGHLTSALTRVFLAGSDDGDGEGVVPGFLSAASEGLLEAVLSGSSHQRCLEMLQGVQLPSSATSSPGAANGDHHKHQHQHDSSSSSSSTTKIAASAIH